MLQHQRVKHQLRNPFAEIVGDNLKCPVCNKSFANRWRVIAHLSEMRQRRVGRPVSLCGPKALEADIPRLDPSLALQLAEKDRLARTQARRAGHSHAVVGRQHANRRPATKLRVVPIVRVRVKTAEAELTARKIGQFAPQSCGSTKAGAERTDRSAKRARH